MSLSVLTRIVISAPWRWGVVLAGAVLVGLALIKRPRRAAPYAVVVVVVLGAAIATWHFSQGPFSELAADIKD